MHMMWCMRSAHDRSSGCQQALWSDACMSSAYEMFVPCSLSSPKEKEPGHLFLASFAF